METNQVIMSIPGEVPVPKFELFQRVRYGRNVGIVTGIEYVDVIQALKESLDYVGWQYTINFTFGVDPQKALGQTASTFYVEESRLKEVSDAE